MFDLNLESASMSNTEARYEQRLLQSPQISIPDVHRNSEQRKGMQRSDIENSIPSPSVMRTRNVYSAICFERFESSERVERQHGQKNFCTDPW